MKNFMHFAAAAVITAGLALPVSADEIAPVTSVKAESAETAIKKDGDVTGEQTGETVAGEEKKEELPVKTVQPEAGQ